VKIFLVLLVTMISLTACSKEKNKIHTDLVNTKSIASKEIQTEAPCDSKEDLLKKLEEKKKEQEEHKKGFSLQGGDTGCTLK